MPNASYQYCYDTDEKYMISNTPEKFKVAYNAVGGLTLKTAQDYVNGTYKQGRTFTHTADSMNHCYVNYSTDGIKVGDYYTITSGYIASVEEKPGIYTTRGEIASMFGPILIIFNIQELMELHIIQPRKFLLLWDGCLVHVQTMRLVVSAQPLSRVERSYVQVRMQMAQPTSSTIVVR